MKNLLFALLIFTTGTSFAQEETDAEYIGGTTAFYEFMGENLGYPSVPWDAGIEGRVNVSFVVEKDGSITNIEVIESPHCDLSLEVVRFVSSMPKWKPATKDGEPVRERMSQPFLFQLPEED